MLYGAVASEIDPQDLITEVGQFGGSGNLAVDASTLQNPIQQGSAYFSGVGGIDISASISENPIKQGSAIFSGSGNLVADATIDQNPLMEDSALFVGSGNLNVDGLLTNPAISAAFSGVGQFSIDQSKITMFKPSNLASLVGWWDASDTSTLTDAGSGHCSQWNDKTANANHVTQTTDSKRPIITSNSINGLTALVFTAASSQYLAKLTVSGLPSTATGISMAAVGYFGNGSQSIFDVSDTTNTNRTAQLIVTSGNINYRNSGTGRAYTAYSDFTNANVFSGTMSTTNGSFIWVNGTVGTNSGTGPQIASLNSTNLRFGMLFQDVLPLNGKIAEIIFCSGDLGTSDRQKLEGYLAWKWGRQSALPGEHPYASYPP